MHGSPQPDKLRPLDLDAYRLFLASLSPFRVFLQYTMLWTVANGSGHPAMEVAIKVQFRRARQRGTREVGVRCPCLCLRRCLAFLVFLIAYLSVAFLVWGGGGRRRGNSWWGVGVKAICHGVGVGVETKARGGVVRIVEEGRVGEEGNRVAWR